MKIFCTAINLLLTIINIINTNLDGLLMQSVSPAKADELTLKKNILSTFAWSGISKMEDSFHHVSSVDFLSNPLFMPIFALNMYVFIESEAKG